MSAWVVKNSINLAGAVISCISSLCLLWIIALKGKGLSTPYRRFIFAISASDVLQSLALVIGPFAVPTGLPQAKWAVGNKSSCAFDGLLLTYGIAWAPLYSCGLSTYYFYKLKRNMTDHQFEEKIERKLHFAFIFPIICCNLYALASDAINPAVTGSACLYATTPTGCRQQPDIYGECDENETSSFVLNLIVLTIIPAVSLVVVIALFTSIFWHIRLREKMFPLPKKPSERNTVLRQDSNANMEIGSQMDEPRATFQQMNGNSSNEVLGRKYKTEMTYQMLMYALVFVVVYIWFACLNLTLLFGAIPNKILLDVHLVLFPLAGLFNILIYTRPAICVLRTRATYLSWFQAFRIILANGGEVPTQEANSGRRLRHAHSESRVKFEVVGQCYDFNEEEESDVSLDCLYFETRRQKSGDESLHNKSDIIGSPSSLPVSVLDHISEGDENIET